MIKCSIVDINLFLKNNSITDYKKMVKQCCEVVYKIINIEDDVFFDINIVNDGEIKKINNEYRKINKITDVISFAFNDNKEIKTPLLGEIFLNYEQASRQSQEYGHSLYRELLFLTIHGLLHLLQYDHDTKSKEDQMNSLTEQIIKGIMINRKYLEKK